MHNDTSYVKRDNSCCKWYVILVLESGPGADLVFLSSSQAIIGDYVAVSGVLVFSVGYL